MKQCLKYMSGFWEMNDYMPIVIAYIFMFITRSNITMIMVLTIAINALSLSMFGMGSGLVYKRDGREMLTLSLPMSRKTIYDTRMYILSAMYFVGILISLLIFIIHSMYVSCLCTIALLLFGHLTCGLCIRKQYFQIIAGIPTLIVSMLYIYEIVNDRVETSAKLCEVLGIVCVVVFVIDVYVWLKERRIFLCENRIRL